MRFSRSATIAILFTLLIVMRLIPPVLMNLLQANFQMNQSVWLWNFSPLFAVCLFCGAMFRERWLAILLPLSVQFAGDVGYWLLSRDVWQGFGMGQSLNYILVIASVIAGMTLPRRPSTGRLALTGFGVTTAHFLISNLAVWAFSPDMYSFDLEGLRNCFTLAIPFYPSGVVSTLVFGQLLFSNLGPAPATEETAEAAAI